MTDSRPIAIFDSGFGGLCFLKQIKKKLPNESIIYFGDNLHSPYGDKSFDQIVAFTKKAHAFLKKHDIKCFVIACNSACSALYKNNRKIEDSFEIIVPSAKALLANSKIKKVAVFATQATTESKIYENYLLSLDPNVELISIPCKGLADLVEAGAKNKKKIEKLISNYYMALKNKGIDAALLACTHYVFIKDIFVKICKNIKIVDPSSFCIDGLKAFLKDKLSNEPPNYIFYTSKDAEEFKDQAQKFLKETIKRAKRINL